MKSLFYSLVNFASISLTLVIPQLLGSSSVYLVALSAIVVGMQAAQSTVVQSNISRLPLGENYRWSALLVIVAAVLITFFPHALELIWWTITLTVGGAILGLGIGRDALEVLTHKGGREYQRVLAIRSLVLLVGAVAGAIVGSWEVLIFALIFSSYVMFSTSKIGEISGSALSIGVYGTVLLGLAGSLFYRNDVTWVRTAVAGSDKFEYWNIYLVVYAGAQAFIGLGVVHFVLSNRNKWRLVLKQRKRLISRISYLGLVVAFGLGCAALYISEVPLIVSMAISLVIVSLVGVVSGFSHAWSRSWAPYLAGILGTTVLIAGLRFLDQPGQALLVANFVTLSVALLGPITADGDA